MGKQEDNLVIQKEQHKAIKRLRAIFNLRANVNLGYIEKDKRTLMRTQGQF